MRVAVPLSLQRRKAVTVSWHPNSATRWWRLHVVLPRIAAVVDSIEVPDDGCYRNGHESTTLPLEETSFVGPPLTVEAHKPRFRKTVVFHRLWSSSCPKLIFGASLRPFTGSCAAMVYTGAVGTSQQATGFPQIESHPYSRF